jgi:hypothetical protein
MPYYLISRTLAADEEEDGRIQKEQVKKPIIQHTVYPIFEDEYRDEELEAILVNLHNRKQINYVYFENMASAKTVWNVDIMLKRYR